MSAIRSFAVQAAGPVTKASVKARVHRWIDRLNELYSQMDDWVKTAAPGAEVLRQTRPQLIEPLMTKYQISGKDIPTYTIVHGHKRVAFVPGEIWIVGANGRVGVTTNAGHHTLVDIGDESGPDWNLVLPSERKSLRPFDRAAFRALLKEGR